MASNQWRLGPFHIGVRFDAAETRDFMRSVVKLPEVDDPSAPVNFSVTQPASAPRGQPREFGVIYRGTCASSRSRTREGLARKLAAHLSHWKEVSEARFACIEGCALVRGDEAIVVPQVFEGPLAGSERVLQRAGYQWAHAGIVCLDPASGRLVVPELDGLLEGGEESVGAPHEAMPAPPGYYWVRTWALDTAGMFAPIARTETIRRLLRLTENAEVMDARVLIPTLAEVVGDAEVLRVGSCSAQMLLDWLASR